MALAVAYSPPAVGFCASSSCRASSGLKRRLHAERLLLVLDAAPKKEKKQLRKGIQRPLLVLDAAHLWEEGVVLELRDAERREPAV